MTAQVIDTTNAAPETMVDVKLDMRMLIATLVYMSQGITTRAVRIAANCTVPPNSMTVPEEELTEDIIDSLCLKYAGETPEQTVANMFKAIATFATIFNRLKVTCLPAEDLHNLSIINANLSFFGNATRFTLGTPSQLSPSNNERSTSADISIQMPAVPHDSAINPAAPQSRYDLVPVKTPFTNEPRSIASLAVLQTAHLPISAAAPVATSSPNIKLLWHTQLPDAVSPMAWNLLFHWYTTELHDAQRLTHHEFLRLCELQPLQYVHALHTCDADEELAPQALYAAAKRLYDARVHLTQIDRAPLMSAWRHRILELILNQRELELAGINVHSLSFVRPYECIGKTQYEAHIVPPTLRAPIYKHIEPTPQVIDHAVRNLWHKYYPTESLPPLYFHMRYVEVSRSH